MGSSATNIAPFLKRLVLRNYRSVAACAVDLDSFTAFVGPNGAGKSNLLDAIQFVADVLRDDLAGAVRRRGGAEGLLHGPTKRASHFGMRLELSLPSGAEATFAFQAGGMPEGQFGILREECRIGTTEPEGVPQYYSVAEGSLRDASVKLQAAVEPDTFYLKAISGIPEFRPLRDALRQLRIYNFDLDAMRDFQSQSLEADVLERDGSNITAVLAKIESEARDAWDRIQEYLQVIVPDLDQMAILDVLDKRTLQFTMAAPPEWNPGFLGARAMSDGTLRALGGLVAAFQGRGSDVHVPLVGIEEPELSLHPDATNALTEALLAASRHRQIVVTSHSPDLLDHSDITVANIRAVLWDRGQTVVAPVDRATRETLREKLFTAGELLRTSQIEPDLEHLAAGRRDLELFDAGSGGAS